MIKPYFCTNTKNTPFALRVLSNFTTNRDGTTERLYLRHLWMPLCLLIVLKIMVSVGIMLYLQKVKKGNMIPMIFAQFCEDTRDALILY